MKLRVRLKYRDEQKLSLIVGRNPRDYILAKKKKIILVILKVEPNS